jgi:large subunit ribosomal protein L2
MAVIKLKPTSPGRRGVVKVTRDHLHKGEGYAPLLEPQFQKSGRNNNGHITTRHKGGGHKHHYRVVDFRRNKDAIPAKVERIEYDPNRTAHIALVCYADGERRYIIAPRNLEVGASLISGSEAPIRVGNTLPIRNIPVGSTIHCIELQPGKGAQIARRAHRPRCWPAKVLTPRSVCAPAKSARSTSNAARPLVKSPTKSTACAVSARLA